MPMEQLALLVQREPQALLVPLEQLAQLAHRALPELTD